MKEQEKIEAEQQIIRETMAEARRKVADDRRKDAQQIIGAWSEGLTKAAEPPSSADLKAAFEVAGKYFWMEPVVRAAAHVTDVAYKDIVGPGRQRDVAKARHVGMWVVGMLFGASYNQISRAFGGRDHTTILHGVRKVDEMVKQGGAPGVWCQAVIDRSVRATMVIDPVVAASCGWSQEDREKVLAQLVVGRFQRGW